MKNLLLAILCFTVVTVTAQDSSKEKYHKARIYYSTNADLDRLTDFGLALDHGKHKKGHFIESDFPESQLNTIESNGIKVEILIKDVGQFYRDQNDPKSPNYVPETSLKATQNGNCDGTISKGYLTPVNYNSGSMGGYLTYKEMLKELDDMKTLYPNLITSKAAISTFATAQGRPIQYVKISDNPSTNESAIENQVLYTAMHHAREPSSLQQTIFYMWYLLENYETNAEIKSIVDNTELYFVPCLNPDGYIFNESNNSKGGGMWRKNRRPNDKNTGVDLNRNYSYITSNGDETWNTAGTSGPSGDTYAGSTPFSEPETQALRWLVEQNDFKVALNAHSYGDLLLFPYGYGRNKHSPEHEIFKSVSEFMVSDNNFNNVISSELYPAAGNSDDFMYGMVRKVDGGTRNKIYAMTPEIGNSFWLPASAIESMCKTMMFTNLSAAQVAGNSATIKDNSASVFIETTASNIDYEIQRIGFESGSFTVSLTPVSTNIITVGAPQPQNSMTLMEKRTGTITLNLNSNTAQGEEVVYDIVVNNGLYDKTTRITKKYGTATAILTEPGDDTTIYWNATNWGVSTTEYNSATSSITDSPTGNYSNNENKTIQLTDALNLISATNANLSFYAKWDIEKNYDYVQLEVSTDAGSTWIPQCGKYTNIGLSSHNGATNQPLYDGKQNDWVLEEIDLSDYLGNTILIRFKLISDGALNKDGFYFDDLVVKILDPSLSTPDYITSNFSVFPNPVNNLLHINSSLSNYTYELYSIHGQLLNKKVGNNNLSVIDCSSLTSGMYLLTITQSGKSKTFKFVKN